MLELEHAEKFLLGIQWIDIILFIMVIAVLTFVGKFIEYSANAIANKFPKIRMLVLGWVPIICFSIYFIGMFAAIYVIINPSRDMLLGFLASGLIAIGFALKDAASSIIAGVVLLVERPFQLGDRISFEEVYGDITAIGLSSVTVLTVEEEAVVTIPNHLFLSHVVTSRSAGTLEMTKIMDIYVFPDSDLEKVQNIMNEVTKNCKFVDSLKRYAVVAKENLSVVGVVNIEMRMECVLKDSTTEKEFMTYYTIEVNKAFKASGIKQIR